MTATINIADRLLAAIQEKKWESEDVVKVGDLVALFASLKVETKPAKGKASSSKRKDSVREELYDESADTCVKKLTTGNNQGKRCTGKKAYTNPDGSIVCSKHKSPDAVKIDVPKPAKKAAAAADPAIPIASRETINEMLKGFMTNPDNSVTITSE